MKKKFILTAFILIVATPLSVGEGPHNSIISTADTSDDRGREISVRQTCGPDLGGCSSSL